MNMTVFSVSAPKNDSPVSLFSLCISELENNLQTEPYTALGTMLSQDTEARSIPSSKQCWERCGRSHKGGGICCHFKRNLMSKESFLKVFIQISPFLTILFKLKIFSCLWPLPSHTCIPSVPLFFLLSTCDFHPSFIIYLFWFIVHLHPK